jgi:hypothetical protein
MNHLNKEVSSYTKVNDTKGITVNLYDWLTIPNAAEVEKLRIIRSTKDEKTQKQLKAALQCVTISGVFPPYNRTDAGLLTHSGLIAIDIDPKDNPNVDMKQVRKAAEAIPYAAYIGHSARGEGLLIIFAIAYPDKHQKHYAAIAQYFKKNGVNIDPSCGNLSRTRCYCYDPDAYFNPSAQVYSTLPKPVPQPTFRKSYYSGSTPDVFSRAVKSVEAKGWQFVDGQKHSYIIRVVGALINYGVPQTETEAFIDKLIPLTQINKRACIDDPYKRYAADFGKATRTPVPQFDRASTTLKTAVAPPRVLTVTERQFIAMAAENPAIIQLAEALQLVNPLTDNPYPTH